MSNSEPVSWRKRLVSKVTRPIVGKFNEGQKERLEAVRYGLAWLKENPEIDPHSKEGREALSGVLDKKYPELSGINDALNDIGYAQYHGWASYLSEVNQWDSGRSRSGR